MNSQHCNFALAARKIIEELEHRGFSADNPVDAIGLESTIYDIIEESINDNVNYGVDTTNCLDEHPLVRVLTKKEREALFEEFNDMNDDDNGWENDLQNQN